MKAKAFCLFCAMMLMASGCNLLAQTSPAAPPTTWRTNWIASPTASKWSLQQGGRVAAVPRAALPATNLLVQWQATQGAPFVGARGPHSRTWLKVSSNAVPDGIIAVRTNVAFVELAAGMHYWQDW